MKRLLPISTFSISVFNYYCVLFFATSHIVVRKKKFTSDFEVKSNQIQVSNWRLSVSLFYTDPYQFTRAIVMEWKASGYAYDILTSIARMIVCQPLRATMDREVGPMISHPS